MKNQLPISQQNKSKLFLITLLLALLLFTALTHAQNNGRTFDMASIEIEEIEDFMNS
ncbi:hypothetical protein [Owenweeksia hongkongensis]|uniref:hypothetical protein n=1 Tax=Owenweeksia hongkongensis TaxID=253245 RepID=UPI003A8D8F27